MPCPPMTRRPDQRLRDFHDHPDYTDFPDHASAIIPPTPRLSTLREDTMRRLLLFAPFVALLAACAPAVAVPTPTPAIATTTAAPPTATLLPSPTPTPTAVPTPTATPLPPGLARLLNALESTWGVKAESITTTAASAAETAQLAKALGVEADSLGQVYKVEAAGATFYASAETGKSYAIRQVPAYFKYEMGKEVDAPAHAEGVEVVRLVDDPTEFSHWGEGQVAAVRYADGQEGWMYVEDGEWQKIYESGFDYEAIYQASVRFLEATGKIAPGATVTPEQVQALLREVGKQYLDEESYFKMKGRWSAGAYVDESAPWWPSKLFGVNLGPMWVRVETKNGEKVNVLVGYLGEPYDKKGDLAVIPIAWGFEKNGEWQNLFGYGYGRPYIQNEQKIDDYFVTANQVEHNLKSNLERKIDVEEIIWVDKNGLEGEGLMKGNWQIGEGQKWWYQNVGGGAKWWSDLSSEERKAVLEDIRDPEGKKVIAVAFYLELVEDKDGMLQQVLRDGGWLPAAVDLYEDNWQLEK